MSALRPHPGGCILSIRAVPNASRDEVLMSGADAIRIKVAAPPDDDRANNRLVRFLAGILELSRGGVELVRGDRGRNKDLLIRGLAPDDVLQRLRASSRAPGPVPSPGTGGSHSRT